MGATEDVHRLFLAQRQRGSAILLVSEDLEEILTLSDRIAVMYAGEIIETFGSEAAELETIGRMMAGVHPRTRSSPPE